MNLRTKLLGLAAAIALCLGVVAPAAADTSGPTGATTNVTITFNEGGTFAVALSSVTAFSSPTVNATTGSFTLTSTVRITYIDTQSYRGQFHVDMHASDFASTLAVPYSSPVEYYKISADKLTLETNYNPQQLHWTSEGCGPGGFPGPTCVHTYRVGDIGATNDVGNSIGNTASVDWTVNKSLEIDRKVAQGWAGTGTGGTIQDMDLDLTVPPAMPATNYSSTLTATVVGETP